MDDAVLQLGDSGLQPLKRKVDDLNPTDDVHGLRCPPDMMPRDQVRGIQMRSSCR